MRVYTDYTAEDFAQDDFFRSWVQRPDAESNSFWTDFLDHYPEKQPIVIAARALLKAVEQMQVMPTQEQGNRIWATIKHRTRQEANPIGDTKEPVQRIGFRSFWMAAAASVVLLLGIGWWFVANPRIADNQVAYSGLPNQSTVVWMEKMNETALPLTVQLADGSQVILQPQSQLRYPEEFSPQTREVQLQGEGFFEVKKNPQKPFRVYANGLVTQVVGTSFTIKALRKIPQVTVAVRTGKVAVYTLKALNLAHQRQTQVASMLLLTPNQQALFDKTSERLTKSLVNEPALLKKPETNQPFVFDNTPVGKVFHTLEESYGIDIKYHEKTLKSCNLTAPLGNEPLFRKLDIICQTIGATYEVWGTQIIISGKGCD